MNSEEDLELKKIIFLLMAFVLTVSGFTVSAKAAGFTDLTEGQRFYDEMSFLENKGIITGYADGTFRPNGEVTRAAAAIMIGRSLNLDGEQKATEFPDVGADQQASGYIASAAATGIIKGYTDGKFHPNETVTRGQMAIFLSRAFHLTEEADVPFVDISPAMVSYQHIKRIVAENLTQGYEDNTFRPNLKVTRAQFSAFLARALNDEFKVELQPVHLSYLRDKNYVYYYHTNYDSQAEDSYYVYSDKAYDNWDVWDVYTNNTYSYSRLEAENSNGYYVGYPESEYQVEIKYPREEGKSWIPLYEGDPAHTITSINTILTTPAGTFYNVVEVTSEDGWIYYYAPNIGLIKRTYNGATELELTKIENR